MQVLHLEQNSDEWLEARRGKITGSKLKDILVKRGTTRKIGFYQLVADKLGIREEDEDDRERGHRLEDEAADFFKMESGKKATQDGMWVSDDCEDIAISPDRVVSKTEALEIKCPKAARHIQTVIENVIPDEYLDQIMQYFIVNEKLKQVHYVSYCPAVTQRPYHRIVVEREPYVDKIKAYKEYQIQVIKEVNAIVEEWAF